MNLQSVPTRGRTLDYAAGVYDIFEPNIHEAVTEDRECLECHHPDNSEEGPTTPHPKFKGCINCHNDEIYSRIQIDGVVESPIYCVAALFQELDILYMYSLVPEKPLRLVYGTFYLAIGDTFYEFIKIKTAV